MNNLKLITIGNAIIDIITDVNDELLKTLNLVKGSMKIVSSEDLNQILKLLKNFDFVAGGSAANTAVGFSSLGGTASFVGAVGNDDFGKKFKTNIKYEGVNFILGNVLESNDQTSKSIILVSNDAERTMCTFIGASTNILFKSIDKSIFKENAIIYIEGYLFDKIETQQAILDICKISKSSNLKIALSLSDKFCVDRHKKKFLNLIHNYVDILFANELEICSLYKNSIEVSINELQKKSKIGSITLGEKGSIIFDKNNIIKIKAVPDLNVIDTTGAGDYYAAGFLFGFSNNLSLEECGNLGAISSGHIITHYGARPKIKLKNLI